jgi:PAS domain-containing protein
MLKHSQNISFGTPIDSMFFSLFDSFSDPAFLIDPTGTILYANTACTARISKYLTDFLGENAYALHSSGLNIPEIAADLREKTEDVLCSGNRLTFEEKQQGKTFRHTITPTCSSDGDISHLFIVVQETIQKRVELDAQKQLDLHKIIHDVVPCSIVLMDAGGRVLWLNQCTKNFIAADPEGEMFGRDAFETIYPDDLVYARERFLRILNNDIPETIEVRRLIQGGKEYSWRLGAVII